MATNSLTSPIHQLYLGISLIWYFSFTELLRSKFRDDIVAKIVGIAKEPVIRIPACRLAYRKWSTPQFDGYDHFPIWLDKIGAKKWCKLCKTSQTQCICTKCMQHLCCSAEKNCFFDYHKKSDSTKQVRFD